MSDFPLVFTRTSAVPLSWISGSVLLRWELKPTSVNLNDFEFYIDRGESPDQIPQYQNVDTEGHILKPLIPDPKSKNQFQINSRPIKAVDLHEFVDVTPQLQNLNKIYYYRIRARRISTCEECTTEPFTFFEAIDLEGLYVIDEHNFKFRDVSGEPCLVYNRKTGGVPCTECYDPVQSKRTRSDCPTCFGTNWDGGFYNPISMYAEIGVASNSSIIEEWGERQPSQTDGMFSNYPFLRPGDVIRRVHANELYRIVQIQPIAKRRIPMMQAARVEQITPGDVEYKIPVDEQLIRDLLDDFNAILRKRAF